MRAAPFAFAHHDVARSGGSSATQTSNLSKLIGRSISVLLACALAVTMCPAAGLAYAAEGGEGGESTQVSAGSGSASADRVSEDVVLDTSGSSSGGEGSEGDAGSAEGEKPEAGAGESGSGDASASADASSKYTDSGHGQTSADVSLKGDATVGTIEYGGLAYTINEDDDTTVSVTGFGFREACRRRADTRSCG